MSNGKVDRRAFLGAGAAGCAGLILGTTRAWASDTKPGAIVETELRQDPRTGDRQGERIQGHSLWGSHVGRKPFHAGRQTGGVDRSERGNGMGRGGAPGSAY